MCELCGGGHHEEKIILCDACDRGCHMFCLDPPMLVVPRGDWMCPLCAADEAAASNAFEEGDVMTLASFEQAAASFKSGWWGDEVRVMVQPPGTKSCRNSWPQCLREALILYFVTSWDIRVPALLAHDLGCCVILSLHGSLDRGPRMRGRSRPHGTSSRSFGGLSKTATKPWRS